MSTTKAPIERDEEPTDRISELEEARLFIAHDRRLLTQADAYLERHEEICVFTALVDLNLVDNCVRAARRSLRSRSFVDHA
jgi:hypothetical protein